MQSISVHLSPVPLNGIRDIAKCFGVTQPIVLEWISRGAPIATIEVKERTLYHAEYSALQAWLIQHGG